MCTHNALYTAFLHRTMLSAILLGRLLLNMISHMSLMITLYVFLFLFFFFSWYTVNVVAGNI